MLFSAVAWILVIRPGLQDSYQLITERSSIVSELRVAEAAPIELSRLARNLKEVQLSLDSLSVTISREGESAALWGELQMAARRRGVLIHNFEPEELVTDGDYVKATTLSRVDGDFHATMLWLNDVERSTLLVRVNSVSVVGEKERAGRVHLEAALEFLLLRRSS
jgi:Tfp pilus assembly protein PilO